MLSGRFGHLFDRPLASLARKINMDPNILTVAGFIVTAVAAALLPRDLRLGGALILCGGAFDVLDGVIARVNDRSTRFGAFLDSVLDRYSDALLFLGFSWYFYEKSMADGVIISIGTMIGALLVSYTRARAEGIGRDCRVGLLERPERILLLAFAAFTGWVMPVMWGMFILTHLTVLQRIFHVWKSGDSGPGKDPPLTS